MSTDAYRKCSKCGTTPIEDGAISFFRFPKPGKTNVLRVRAWAKYCWPEEDWLSIEALTKLFTKNKVLCRRHFEDDCFTDDSKKNLSRFSVPGDKNFVNSLLETLRKDMHLMRQNDMPQALQQTHNSTQVPLNLPEQPQQELMPGHMSQSSPPKPSQVSIQGTSPVPGTSQQQQQVFDMFTQNLKPKTHKRKRILRPLKVNKISELTEREKKLYAICTKSIKEINRLRSQLKSKKNTNKVHKICENENIKKLFNLNLSNSFVILLQNQLRNCKKKPKGRRYTLEDKIMTLTLYKKSPSCYRLLRRMFSLPSQSTLKKLLNRIPLQAGINPQIFAALKNMAESHIPEENLCVLSFDEMAIRKHLQYNERLDIIEGYQDHGNHGRDQQIASNALVFMVAGIRKKWKQPIAFYFSGKSVTSDRLSVIIKEVLKKCFEVGLNVMATVCDLSRVNIKALENLGSTTENPFFIFEGHELSTILDPPHLMKCTRNLFMKYNIECSTEVQHEGKFVKGVAKWSHVQQFYELDNNNPNFVFAPALSEQHLKPNSKQKMRVYLAVQVFSHSVAGGILSKIGNNAMPAEAHATVSLLEKFDKLFDALNADTQDLRRGKKYSTNLTKKTPHLELFHDMRKFIMEMKFIGSSSRPPSQMGWIRTINAVERLWKNLLALNVSALSTRRLNQDPLENCFGCIRYHCGSNDNPTVEQFVSGIKTAIINNLRHTKSKRNCEDDTATLCNNLKSFLLPEIQTTNRESSHSSESIMPDLQSMTADATRFIEQASPEAQACTYVCGFIFKKLKHVDCVDCKSVFLTSEATQLHVFTTFKEYESNKNALHYANKEFVQCVEVSALKINHILNASGWKNNIKTLTTSALNEVDFAFLNKCTEHQSLNKTHIIESTFHICLRRLIVLKNRAFGEEEQKKSLERRMSILRS